MPPRRPDPPILWATNAPKNNVIVLTERAVYVATVAAKEVPRVDLGLEEGEAPEDLLDRYTKILLKRRTRFQYWTSTTHPNTLLTLYHDVEGVERKQVLAMGVPANRDALVTELNARLGDWPASETPQHPVLTLLKYFVILFVIVAGTLFLALAEWLGWIRAGPAFVVLCLDLCGIWGVFGAGSLIFLLVVVIGVRELVQPPSTIIHEPDDN